MSSSAKTGPKESFECVVVTGLSGAGKSTVLRALEDLGFFCVDNLPLQLLPSLLQLYRQWGQPLHRVAVGVDVRTGRPARDLVRSLEDLSHEGFHTRVLFVDADLDTLFRRYSETRRRHPLGRTVREGIRREQKLLAQVQERADKLIDTSRLTPTEVKELVLKTLGLQHARGMGVLVVSFGYKYGLPLDADIVWDVRFLPNPNYSARLRPRTGQDPKVARYVFAQKSSVLFMNDLTRMMNFLLQRFSSEGKSYLTVAIGCTGGRHRSVAVAERLAQAIRQEGTFDVRVQHRDAGRD